MSVMDNQAKIQRLQERLLRQLGWLQIHWRPCLFWLIVISIFAGICFGMIQATTGHDYFTPIFDTFFRAGKVFLVIADVFMVLLYAWFAWWNFKSPASATPAEAERRIRGLAMMLGAMLVMFVTQVFLFRH